MSLELQMGPKNGTKMKAKEIKGFRTLNQHQVSKNGIYIGAVVFKGIPQNKSRHPLGNIRMQLYIDRRIAPPTGPFPNNEL